MRKTLANDGSELPARHSMPRCSTEQIGDGMLRCPACLARIDWRGEQLACSDCCRVYEVVDGIPVLPTGSVPYFGEFAQKDMAQLLQEASHDVETTLRRWLRHQQVERRLGEYILGSGRAGWKFLLPLTRSSRVLDIGCGWGAVAHSMSESCDCVMAMDATLERLQFLRIRAEQENIEGLRFVCSGDGNYLPFDDGAFDIVIMNGVLEWIPSGKSGHPQALQEAFLREVRRVLQPQGILHLAIENRYAWRTWFQYKDGHTGLRFVPWLPRRLADAYCRLKGHGAYRNFLYGRRGYERLLDAAGFRSTRFYVPLPGYHYPSALVPVHRTRELRAASSPLRGNLLKRVRRTATSLLKSHFPSNYGIIACSDTECASFLDRLCQQLECSLSGVSAGRCIPSTYRINGEMGMVTVVMESVDRLTTRFVLKLPLHERGRLGLQREARLLAECRDERSSLFPIAEWLPRILHEARFENQYYVVHSIVTGRPIQRNTDNHRSLSKALHESSNFALRLHRCSEQQNVDWSESIGPLVHDKVRCLMSLAPTGEAKEALLRLADSLAAYLQQQQLPVVVGHGDFKIGNCLYNSSDGRLSGVLDWGAFTRQELPLYDLSFLLVDYLAMIDGKSIQSILHAWLISGEHHGRIADWLQDKAQTLNMPWTSESLRAIGQYQWLQRMTPLSTGHETRRFDFRFVDAMFDLLSSGSK